MGIDVEAAGILILMVFFAWLADLLHRAGGPAWLPLLAFAMVAWAVTSIATNAVWVALVRAGSQGSDSQLLAAMRDVARELSTISYFFLGLAMATIAAAALTTHKFADLAELAGSGYWDRAGYPRKHR